MASYTPVQYREQTRVLAIIGASNVLGRCPVCHGPQGTWRTGEKRMTCGRDACYRKWLGIKTREQAHETTTDAR
jgi:hypothetical protein